MVQTSHIIEEYFRIRLKQKGFELKNRSSTKNNKESQEEVVKICKSLDKVSNELLDFIEQKRMSIYDENMTDELVNNCHYDTFKVLADELFKNGAKWTHIVTLLVFGSECATKILNSKNSRKNNNDSIFTLCDLTTKYIDENLRHWISEQEGGWLAIENFEVTVPQNSKGLVVFKQYFGVAAIAVFLSGLYLCSKF